jgi:ankyrin repeat protein
MRRRKSGPQKDDDAMRHNGLPLGSFSRRRFVVAAALAAGLGAALFAPAAATAQTAPSEAERAAYTGLHRAAASGDVAQIRKLLAEHANPNARDAAGRSPLHVAAFGSHYDAVRALVAGGGDINALENRRYDVITIAAVKDDVRMVKLALELGGNAKLVTSPYDGTALIAAAHLGHAEVVQALIDGGAPLDHVNNLGWTALIEAVILGDGGPRHQATVAELVAAGANRTIADRSGMTPLRHAQHRGYQKIVATLQ